MNITVNGAPRETRARTLAELLEELARRDGLRLDAVATAVNGAFAPAAERPRIALKERDAIEILSPRQGG